MPKNERRIAAVHFGGVTIECLLKHIIYTSLPVDARREWKTSSSNPGHTITNPGHSYQEALRRHARLKSRVESQPFVLGWLNDVENPGSHFIDMRYVGKEPEDDRYKRWLKSYKSLVSWLQRQSTTL